MNLVILSGYLGADPETRPAQSTGESITNIRLATKDGKKDASGQYESTWHNCVAFGKTADLIQKFFFKGSYIELQGRIQNDVWQDKTTGEKKYGTKIIVNNIGFGPKQEGGGDSQRQAPPANQFAKNDVSEDYKNKKAALSSLDDIPF